MALDAATIFDVRTTGDDTFGGGFADLNPGTSVDYSQQDTAQLTLTDGATSGIGVTTFTSATGGFTAAMEGNVLRLASGTNVTVGYYQITGFTDTNTVTLDRAPDDGVGGVSGGNFKVGGAIASPGLIGSSSDLANGNKIYIKSGTYTLTTTTAGAGGPISGPSTTLLFIIGYQDTHGDLNGSSIASNPVIDAAALTTFDIVTLTGAGDSTPQHIAHVTVDGQSNSGVRGFVGNNDVRVFAHRCYAKDCAANGFNVLSACGCKTFGGGHGFSDCLVWECIAVDGTGTGFSESAQGFIYNSIAARMNIGFSFDIRSRVVGCIADSCTGDGFFIADDPALVMNCVSTNNGGWGFGNVNAATASSNAIVNCYTYNNTSGAFEFTTGYEAILDTSMTSDPWVDAANNDFRPNNASTGGAILRQAALIPPDQQEHRDVGAVQHAEPVISSNGMITVPEFTFPLQPVVRLSGDTSTFRLDALNEKFAVIFQWPHADTVISKLYCKTATNAGSGTITGSIFNVTLATSPAEPSTMISGASDTWAWTGSNDNTGIEFSLGTPPTLSRGSYYAMHIEVTSFTSGSIDFTQFDNVTWGSDPNSGPQIPFSTFDTAGGTWVVDLLDYFMLGLIDENGKSHFLLNVLPGGTDGVADGATEASGMGNITFSNASTNDEIGNTFTLDAPMRVSGIWFSGDINEGCDFTLYSDPLGTPVAIGGGAVSVDKDAQLDTSDGSRWVALSSDVLLDAGTKYGVAIKSTTATANEVPLINCNTVAMKGQLPCGVNWNYAVRDGGTGAFTETTTRYCAGVGLVVNGISKGSAIVLPQKRRIM